MVGYEVSSEREKRSDRKRNGILCIWNFGKGKCMGLRFGQYIFPTQYAVHSEKDTFTVVFSESAGFWIWFQIYGRIGRRVSKGNGVFAECGGGVRLYGVLRVVFIDDIM